MNNDIIKVGTFFSGIGAPEKALERLKKEGYIKNYKVEFFSEIDKYAIESYCVIHNINKDLNLGDIKLINGKNLPYCDLWIGGFPCQDISAAGKMRGFGFKSATRSSLGWEMIRLLREIKEKPKYVIFENVSMITSKKFKDTLNLFKKDLEEIGYTLYDDILCAADYGIPQSRKRYFLVAILNDCKKFTFPKGMTNKQCLKNFLEKTVDEKYQKEVKERILKFIDKKEIDFALSGIDLINFPENLEPESGFFTILNFTKIRGMKYEGNVIRDDIDLFKFLFEKAHTKIIPGSAIMWPYDELVVRLTFAIEDKTIISSLLLIKKAIGGLK